MSATEKTVSEKIREDWGTLRHFCKKHDINDSCLSNALSGRTGYVAIVNKLIELGYIESADDLKKQEKAA